MVGQWNARVCEDVDAAHRCASCVLVDHGISTTHSGSGDHRASMVEHCTCQSRRMHYSAGCVSTDRCGSRGDTGGFDEKPKPYCQVLCPIKTVPSSVGCSSLQTVLEALGPTSRSPDCRSIRFLGDGVVTATATARRRRTGGRLRATWFSRVGPSVSGPPGTVATVTSRNGRSSAGFTATAV